MRKHGQPRKSAPGKGGRSRTTQSRQPRVITATDFVHPHASSRVPEVLPHGAVAVHLANQGRISYRPGAGADERWTSDWVQGSNSRRQLDKDLTEVTGQAHSSSSSAKPSSTNRIDHPLRQNRKPNNRHREPVLSTDDEASLFAVPGPEPEVHHRVHRDHRRNQSDRVAARDHPASKDQPSTSRGTDTVERIHSSHERHISAADTQQPKQVADTGGWSSEEEKEVAPKKKAQKDMPLEPPMKQIAGRLVAHLQTVVRIPNASYTADITRKTDCLVASLLKNNPRLRNRVLGREPNATPVVANEQCNEQRRKSACGTLYGRKADVIGTKQQQSNEQPRQALESSWRYESPAIEQARERRGRIKSREAPVPAVVNRSFSPTHSVVGICSRQGSHSRDVDSLANYEVSPFRLQRKRFTPPWDGSVRSAPFSDASKRRRQQQHAQPFPGSSRSSSPRNAFNFGRQFRSPRGAFNFGRRNLNFPVDDNQSVVNFGGERGRAEDALFQEPPTPMFRNNGGLPFNLQAPVPSARNHRPAEISLFAGQDFSANSRDDDFGDFQNNHDNSVFRFADDSDPRSDFRRLF